MISAAVLDKMQAVISSRSAAHLPGALKSLSSGLDRDALAVAMARGGDLGLVSSHKLGEPYSRGDSTACFAYLDQATLILSEAERFFPCLFEACDDLATVFHYVSVRLVLEPPCAGCGGPPLASGDDVLAVQLWGERAVTVAAPLGSVRVSAPRPQPLVQTTVKPGDCLLLPSGLECRAGSSLAAMSFSVKSSSQAFADANDQDGPVLFALFTLRTREHSMGSSLLMYLSDLLRSADLPPDADLFLRSAVTGRTREQLVGRGSGEIAEGLNNCVGELMSRISAAGLRKHYAERMEKLRETQRLAAAKQRAEPVEKSDSEHHLVLGSHLIRVARGVVLRCQDGDATAQFRRGAETLNLPIAETASYMLADLSDGLPHLVSSLRCSDGFERLCVCQILLLKRCLEVVPQEA